MLVPVRDNFRKRDYVDRIEDGLKMQFFKKQ